MRSAALLLLLVAAACGGSTVTAVKPPKGGAPGAWYRVVCKRTMKDCRAAADRACPKGYDEDHTQESTAPPQWTAESVAYSDTWEDELLIRCR
jgi:hypothetical protein